MTQGNGTGSGRMQIVGSGEGVCVGVRVGRASIVGNALKEGLLELTPTVGKDVGVALINVGGPVRGVS